MNSPEITKRIPGFSVRIRGFLFLYGIVTLVIFSLWGCRTSVEKDPYSTVADVSYDTLRQEFENPPNSARIRSYWWWLNSNVTKECITSDLEAMKANGYGGAIIFDAGSSNYRVALKTEAGPAFLSEQWLELFAHAIREADRLGMEISINVQSGWNPGGPSVTPEQALKRITFSDTTVQGPQKIELTLPDPPARELYRDLAVQAVRNIPGNETSGGVKYLDIKSLQRGIGSKGVYPLHLLRESAKDSLQALSDKDVMDISSFVENGKLVWDVPEGSWSVIRYGMTNTGVKVSTASDGWDGLSMDHLNREALEKYDRDVISVLMKTAKEAGNSLKFIHTDSWEMGVANWTDDFAEEFKNRRGYDLTPWLPVITGRVIQGHEISDRFLRDFRRTVADLVAEEFYKTFREIAHTNQMYTHPESGGPHSAPIDAVQTMKFNDVPMGEFWVRSNTHRVKDPERLAVKQSASVAHIYGKRFVAAEGPTSIGPQWERPPKDCKNVIDRIFCSGVNRIVWHTYTASPDEYGEPGNEYFAGTHLNRHATWWEQSKDFVSYMNRTSSMLSQGLFVADALYYYGDDSPNFIFYRDEVTDLGRGYHWDKCSFDLIMNDIRIQDGKIVLPDGMNYRILVLPDEKFILPEVLVKLEQLVRQGMILVGPKPLKASGLKNYPDSDKQVQEIAEKLWASIDGRSVTSNTYGKGVVFSGMTPGEVLKQLKIGPDFDYQSTYPDAFLDFIHRQTKTEDVYFVVNRLARHGINDTEYRYLTDLPDRYEQVTAKFRVTGKVPELWDPQTGKITELAAYREENGYTLVPLHLHPEGSCFVVFREKSANKHVEKIEHNGIDVFPGITDHILPFPSFRVYRQDEQLKATFFHAGEWKLHWSDGTTTSYEEKIPHRYVFPEKGWSLTFREKWGPGETIDMDTLLSWSDHPDERIRNYSGTADYSGTITLDENIDSFRIYLDLGNVQEIASLKINGKEAGTAWIAPFFIDVTDLMVPGKNEMVIPVTNSWVNRLIGDSYLSPENRFTKTNIIKFEGEDKETFIRKSGLTGSVKCILVKEVNL